MADIRTVLVQSFQTTDALKQAEQALKAAAKQPDHVINVLKVVDDGSVDQPVRLAAAVKFKNIIKSSWVEDNESDVEPVALRPEERVAVKQFLVTLMLQSEERLRAQLSEALTIIANADYPSQWPTLMPELVTHLASPDVSVVEGSLHTIAAVCKRFRHSSIEECNDVLDYTQQQAAKPVLEAAQRMQALTPSASGDKAAMTKLCAVVRSASDVTYSLNVHGLSMTMEAFVEGWMAIWKAWLELDAPVLKPADEDDESPLDAMKATVCTCCQQFLEMQESEMEAHLGDFVRLVWGLLVACTSAVGQDNLALAAISFLTAVCRSVHYKLFEAGDTIKQICEGIVIPNVRFRDDDQESFEMNYVEYIRRDLQGSDADTRRRAACDFVKCLVDKIPSVTTEVVSSYIGALLEQYRVDPAGSWARKDCAMYLVMALAVKGKTLALGATALNPLVDIVQFYAAHVLPELSTDDVNVRPVLKADALRFVHLFRSQLDKGTLLGAFPALIALLKAESNVVHSYAAITLERALALKVGGAQRFAVADISAQLGPLLRNLFAAFDLPGSSDNEYVMKCIVQLIAFVGGDIIPVAPMCLDWLTAKLLAVCKLPIYPGFNHNLFESVAALISATARDQSVLQALEEKLFPAFDVVLQQDVQDLHPYVFQIFALLIVSNRELRPDYVNVMLQPFLRHEFWERKGNIPALTSLMQAYLKKCAPAVVEKNALQPMLGIFQKLLSMKRHVTAAYDLIASIVVHVPLAALQQYLSSIFTFLFQALTGKHKSPRNTVAFIVAVSAMIVQHGPAVILGAMDSAQPGSSTAILGQVIVNNVKNVAGPEPTRTVAIAMTSVLQHHVPLRQDPATLHKLLDGVVALLTGETSTLSEAQMEVAEEALDGQLEYSNEFSQLTHARFTPLQLAPQVEDAGRFLATSLAALSQQQPGLLVPCIQQLPQKSQQYLSGIAATAGVSIA